MRVTGGSGVSAAELQAMWVLYSNVEQMREDIAHHIRDLAALGGPDREHHLAMIAALRQADRALARAIDPPTAAPGQP